MHKYQNVELKVEIHADYYERLYAVQQIGLYVSTM